MRAVKTHRGKDGESRSCGRECGPPSRPPPRNNLRSLLPSSPPFDPHRTEMSREPVYVPIPQVTLGQTALKIPGERRERAPPFACISAFADEWIQRWDLGHGNRLQERSSKLSLTPSSLAVGNLVRDARRTLLTGGNADTHIDCAYAYANEAEVRPHLHLHH